MKKIVLSVVILLIATLSFGQISTPTGTVTATTNNTGATAGNIGIGTTNPTAKLDVQGIIKSFVPAYLGSTLNNFQLLDERAGRVGNIMFNRLWTIRDTNGSDWFSARFHDGISVDSSFIIPHIDTRTWWERDPQDNIQSWGNAADTYLTLNNGNLGIGTTTPTAKLVVNGNSELFGGANKIYGHNDSTNYYIGHFPVAGSDGLDIHWYGGVRIADYTGTILQTSNGKVGIGTTNPDEKLTVNGTIHATEVKVTATVPADYVFQKYYTGKSELKSDYIMPTLAEIESFSKKNNHLPNVPSAKEMQEKGMSLGEMSNLLLQKVEELTLYAIEQEKKNLIQSEEIQELKKVNKEFKSLSERLYKIENQLK